MKHIDITCWEMKDRKHKKQGMHCMMSLDWLTDSSTCCPLRDTPGYDAAFLEWSDVLLTYIDAPEGQSL